MKSIKIILSAFAFFLLGNQIIVAQTKRALFIAIDTYRPEGISGPKEGGRWPGNLDGCVNDAKEVKELVGAKYGFTDAKNIVFIQNQEATRSRIIKELNDLIEKSQKGDVVFIYYAGHGSQVYNSLSPEQDKKDETMVPADVWTGTKDIRDKEIAILLNKLVDKGVTLTVIFDSCHSGSVGRGKLTNNPPKLRFTSPDMEDVKDATVIKDPPETKGALIISSAQDFECASEQEDENGNPHGAFTIALLKALQSLPSSASAEEIFTSARAILKYNGKTQEPVLACNDTRKQQNLFGIDRANLPTSVTIAILDPRGTEEIIVQGGWAVGITKGSILENTDKTIKIQIVSVDGVNKSTAKLVSGDFSKVNAGNMYAVVNWATAENALRVYIPQSDLSYDQVSATAAELANLAKEKNITLIEDPAKVSATHTVFYTDQWYLGLPDGKSSPLGKAPKTKDIVKLINGATAQVFVSLPPYKALRDLLIKEYTENTAVEVAKNSSNINYCLIGRWVMNQIQYSYMIPEMNSADTAYVGTLPVRTDFIPIKPGNSEGASVDTLMDYSLRLAKVKAWLALAAPADGVEAYPFSLALKNYSSKQIISSGNVNDGDIFGLVLLADKSRLAEWDKEKRYVYVFALGNDGSTTLYFPLSGSVENKLPILQDDKVPDEMPLGNPKLFRMKYTGGMDTYVMITTDEPLPNPKMLEVKGVKTRSAARGSWVTQLMDVGSNTRGELLTPTNWSIQRVSVRAVK